MIRLENIVREFGNNNKAVQALNDINLTIDLGEYVAIMGPSGSGKSTLLHILGCLDRPTSGSYLLGGRDVSDLDDSQLSRIRNDVFGFVFQQFHLLPRLNTLKNTILPKVYTEEYDAHSTDKAVFILEALGLGDKLTAKPGQLSGGQQQRVAIARALINDPSIILADEPTGNLDSGSSREIMDIFRTLNQEGRTLIVVTHEEEIGSKAQRLIRIHDGRVVSA